MEGVAQKFGVSRVRIHQMLNLLNLDKRIIQHLTQTSDQKEINYWSERKLRNLLQLPEKNQYAEFKESLRCVKSSKRHQN